MKFRAKKVSSNPDLFVVQRQIWPFWHTETEPMKDHPQVWVPIMRETLEEAMQIVKEGEEWERQRKAAKKLPKSQTTFYSK